MTKPTDQPSKPDDAAARLMRLEEHAAFSAHETEQLGEQVRALMTKLEALRKRIEAVEVRLRLAEAGSQSQER